MISTFRIRPLRLRTRPSIRQPTNHRTFSNLIQIFEEQLIQPLSTSFIQHPFPLSYTTTTILLTLTLRSMFTLPISLWTRGRIRRFEERVVPEFRRFRSHLVTHVAKRDGFKDDREIGVYKRSLQKLVSSRFFFKKKNGVEGGGKGKFEVSDDLGISGRPQQFKKELSRLQDLHKCRPMLTILGSISVHVPLIITFTQVLRHSIESQDPKILQELSPILGNSLGSDDLGLVLVCWISFLVNLELNSSFQSFKRDHQVRSTSKSIGFWTPERIRTTGFVTGVFMMAYASFQPALVVLYWTTSNFFSIVQSLCFNHLDRKRLLERKTEVVGSEAVDVKEKTRVVKRRVMKL